MTQKVDQVVTLAERVTKLRAELAAAETELERMVTGRLVPAKSRPGRPSVSSVPVAQRVRQALARRKLTFGELKGLVLRPGENPFAVRSAVSKDRERGVIGYDGEHYFLVGNGDEKEKAQPPSQETGPIAAEVAQQPANAEVTSRPASEEARPPRQPSRRATRPSPNASRRREG